jgi:hypothetical protein
MRVVVLVALSGSVVSSCSKTEAGPPPSAKPAPAAEQVAPPPAPPQPAPGVQTTPKGLFAEFAKPNADRAAVMAKYSAGVTFTAKVVSTGGEDVGFYVDGNHQIIGTFVDPSKAMAVKVGDALTVACKVKRGDDSGVQVSDCTGTPADPNAVPADTGPTKVDQLGGLTIDFTGGVDRVMGEVYVVKGPKGAVFLEQVTQPKRIAEAKADADGVSAKNYKQDKLADGYAITYDNVGTAGANYFVEVQRTIDKKVYRCSTLGRSSDEQQAVLAACKTLRK